MPAEEKGSDAPKAPTQSLPSFDLLKRRYLVTGILYSIGRPMSNYFQEIARNAGIFFIVVGSNK